MIILALALAAAMVQGSNVGSPCQSQSATTLTQATADRCQAEAAERTAATSPAGSRERAVGMEQAALLFRRVADLTTVQAERLASLDGLARLYDAEHLNRLDDQEAVLRELIGAMPDDLAPMYRLAQTQEQRGFVDAAEETLQSARRREPDTVEPYRRLAQFYARRALAIQPPRGQVQAGPDSPDAGKPDERGVFSIGGDVAPPRRDGVAQMPDEARLLGVEGAVRVEIVVDERGEVAEARVVRSVPLLDDEAVRAVRQWRFAPTIVNGKPVPVRMQVVVNFALR